MDGTATIVGLYAVGFVVVLAGLVAAVVATCSLVADRRRKRANPYLTVPTSHLAPGRRRHA
jgi:hypothetical protein